MPEARAGLPTIDRTDTPLSPRIHALREMYWAKTHAALTEAKVIEGSGDPSLVGHAKDFAALLEATPVQLQEHELLSGIALARPAEGSSLSLGYYNPHYPPGHHTVLRLGFSGIRDRAREKLQTEADPGKREFLEAVAVAHDAACRFAARTARELRESAGPDAARVADACEELADGPPRTFHGALQAFWFVCMFGGFGCIGRFDQWMWPFLELDLDEGRLTEDEARELLQSLWVKLNFFGRNNDTLRNISMGGQTREGEDGCNPLTFMCIEATEALRLPEPKINVRFHAGSPPELLAACSRCLAKGLSQPSLYNDEVALPALARVGVPLADARQYCNDGCEEIILGGMCTSHFTVHDALSVLNETVFRAEEHPYESFDEVVDDLKGRLRRWMPDDSGPTMPVTHPFLAATIDDCLEEASSAGARYHITGNILAEVSNVADGLAAIKRFVFEEGRVSWAELIDALRGNFEEDEVLRQMLLGRAPKFGNDDDCVDALATDIAEDFLDGVLQHARNGDGPGCKRIGGLMSFGLQGRRELPATPDGRRQGDNTANSYSPAPGRDRSGPTAVLNSVARLDATKAPFGVTLDLALHTSALDGPEGLQKLTALLRGFLEKPCCTTLQLNVLDRETLLRAQADPTNPEFRTLIVRVWGFSAVFPELIPDLQDHVIQRTQHGL